jgi:hypothetical protein
VRFLDCLLPFAQFPHVCPHIRDQIIDLRLIEGDSKFRCFWWLY